MTQFVYILPSAHNPTNGPDCFFFPNLVVFVLESDQSQVPSCVESYVSLWTQYDLKATVNQSTAEL